MIIIPRKGSLPLSSSSIVKLSEGSIITSVVCVIQTMLASRVDAYINVWRNISEQQ